MRVKVWNDSPYDWKEKFKGEDIFIKSKSFIEMEFYEAHEFKGQYFPIALLADETQDPKTFKTIRIEKLSQEQKDEVEDGQEIFQCNLCKKIYTTESALLKHSEAQHAERQVVDEMAEEALPKAKRGPGRPKAEARAE